MPDVTAVGSDGPATEPVLPTGFSLRSAGLRLVGDHWSAGAEARGSAVLLHGGGQRRHSWHRTGARLAEQGWNSYALDARGHGDSDWSPEGNYLLTALVADLVSLRNTIGEELILIGASMGGMTSLIGQGEIGGIARALVLVDIAAKMEPAGVQRIREFMTHAPDGFSSLEDVADAVASYNPHRRRPHNADGLRRNVRQGTNGRWYWHWDPKFLDGPDEPTRESGYARTRAAAARISVPTMIVHGGKSDIVTQEGVDEMLDLIPGSVAVRVGAAGHMVAGDDNDVFTTRLASFLDDLPG